ncbi:hypothetical protein FO488_04085 [Geobacter sp. FeAm09]|uniref:hypothetical protein n=1 Tax=Geobacter sp. FeAm09 TaxID=2597769 RepID=UPI0011EC05CE|nr:hypothetical protein [Geobacter sp. FeAm09]QEM67404.1 hypothetical protein FO488_04085 [Geobacter sp. FeAm09]
MILSDEVTKKGLAWLSRQTAAMRIEVFRLAMNLRRETLNRLRATANVDAKNSPEIEEQSLLTAIQKMRQPRLKSSDALEEIAARRAASAKSSKNKKSPKTDLLITLMPEIIKLRETGMSYAEIAKALKRKTRKGISKSLIQSVCVNYNK